MADSVPSPHNRAPEATTTTTTVVENVTDEQDHEVPTLKLRLKKPRKDKKVMWTTETVDNEHLNKKKSKCCCIYHKPRKFDESSSSSSSDSDEECEHCKGHVDKKKKRKGSQDHNHSHENSVDHDNSITPSAPPQALVQVQEQNHMVSSDGNNRKENADGASTGRSEDMLS